MGADKHETARRNGGPNGSRRQRKLARPDGPFVAMTTELLTSPAFYALSPLALKALMRLVTEHAAHGGTMNGKLQVSYDQLTEAGITRKRIRAVLNELHALGLVRTSKDDSPVPGLNPANLYRLTFLATRDPDHRPTNEWKKVTAEIAEQHRRHTTDGRTANLSRVPLRDIIDSSRLGTAGDVRLSG